MTKIKVYTKFQCPQCEMTKIVLRKEGIPFETINVEESQDALNYVKYELGFSTTPVVIKEGMDAIVGFNPERLKELNN